MSEFNLNHEVPVQYSKCPVSGLKITQRPEWIDIHISEKYRVTAKMVGDQILHVKPSGSGDQQTISSTLEVMNKIVQDNLFCINGHIRVIDLSDSEASKSYVKGVGKSEHVLGVIFIGIPSMTKLSIKLGQKLKITHARVLTAINYKEAIQQAIRLLDVKTSPPAPRKIENDSPQRAIQETHVDPPPFENKFEEILEILPEGYGEFKTDGDVTFQNRSLQKILGVDRGDTQRLNIKQILTRDNWEKMMSAVKTMRKHRKQGKIVEIKIAVNKGSDRWLEVSLTPLENERVSGVFRDVSRRKNREKQRGDQLKQLQANQKMRPVGILSGSMAYGFDQVLSGIQQYINGLKEQQDEEWLKGTRTLVKNGLTLTRMLSTRAKQNNCQVKPVDINKLITDTQKKISTRKNIKVAKKFTSRLPKVLMDPSLMEQVFKILYSNAQEAMAKGGDLVLKTSIAMSREIKNPNPKPSTPKYISFSVQDSGVGIPSKDFDQIFLPFFTTKKRRGALGLGLTTAFDIVQAHNGYINFTSQKKQGTTFTVYLPIY